MLDAESLASVLGPLILYQKGNHTRVASLDNENSSKKFAQILIQNYRAIFSVVIPSTSTSMTAKSPPKTKGTSEETPSESSLNKSGFGTRKKSSENVTEPSKTTSGNSSDMSSSSGGIKAELKRRFTKTREKDLISDEKEKEKEKEKKKKKINLKIPRKRIRINTLIKMMQLMKKTMKRKRKEKDGGSQLLLNLIL